MVSFITSKLPYASAAGCSREFNMMALTLQIKSLLAIHKLFGLRAMFTVWVSDHLMLAAGCDLAQSTQAQMLLSLPPQQAALWSLSYSVHGSKCLLESRTHARKAQAAATKSLLGDVSSHISYYSCKIRQLYQACRALAITASEGVLALSGALKAWLYVPADCMSSTQAERTST